MKNVLPFMSGREIEVSFKTILEKLSDNGVLILFFNNPAADDPAFIDARDWFLKYVKVKSKFQKVSIPYSVKYFGEDPDKTKYNFSKIYLKHQSHFVHYLDADQIEYILKWVGFKEIKSYKNRVGSHILIFASKNSLPAKLKLL